MLAGRAEMGSNQCSLGIGLGAGRVSWIRFARMRTQSVSSAYDVAVEGASE